MLICSKIERNRSVYHLTIHSAACGYFFKLCTQYNIFFITEMCIITLIHFKFNITRGIQSTSIPVEIAVSVTELVKFREALTFVGDKCVHMNSLVLKYAKVHSCNVKTCSKMKENPLRNT